LRALTPQQRVISLAVRHSGQPCAVACARQ
jgi:hypothetical protein